MEATTCEEIDTVRAFISSDEELVEVYGCISDAKLCEDDSTCMSDFVVNNFDSVSYHSLVSETKSLHKR